MHDRRSQWLPGSISSVEVIGGRGKSAVIYSHIMQNNVWDEYHVCMCYNEQATRATGSVDRNCIIFLAICKHILRSEIEIVLQIMMTGIRRFNSWYSSFMVILEHIFIESLPQKIQDIIATKDTRFLVLRFLFSLMCFSGILSFFSSFSFYLK